MANRDESAVEETKAITRERNRFYRALQDIANSNRDTNDARIKRLKRRAQDALEGKR